MQRAILTDDGYLFLELLDGSSEWSDGEMTVSSEMLAEDAIGYRLYADCDAPSFLSERVARVRAAMLVNC